MEYIEVTGKTVDEAITNACTKLGIPSNKLDYEVLDKGSNGLFGLFNSKPAKIQAREKSEEEIEAEAKKAEEEAKAKAEAEKAAAKAKEEAEKAAAKAKEEAAKVVKAVEKKVEAKTEAKAEVKAETKSEPKVELSQDEIKSRITTFLDSMFGAMNMKVNVAISFDEEEDTVNVDLSGDNMGVLIGKRGQTLDSIQYLTSLVVNKNKDKYVRIKLDTENYRDRRKETLESLAKNIAYKVKRSRRSVSLEPMNPYDRRIIHAALQNDKFVSTKSEGEEPFRHVVVFLDREKSGNANNNRYNNK